MARIRGIVKWYDDTKGFGFIERDDKGDDVFLHRTSLARTGGYLVPLAGDVVEFDVVVGAKGAKASDVDVIKHADGVA